MLFCPTCANILVISADTGVNKWACNTCAYEFPITKQVRRNHPTASISVFNQFRLFKMTSRTRLKRKEIDDVLGGDEMWKHADQTQGKNERVFGCINVLWPVLSASCDKCNFNSAYFYQLQIRSADEPMTTCQFLASLSNIWLTVFSISSLSVGILLLLFCSSNNWPAPVAFNVLTSGVKIE